MYGERENHVALVGPGRTRNGLGPFVAGFLEECGMRVVAAAGRDPARTARACAALGARLGHPVAAFTDVGAMLAARRPALLAIHAPAAAHLAALRAAADVPGGVDVLCDKPLVAAGQTAAGLAAVDALVGAGRIVVEACQWPQMLASFDALWPGWRRGHAHRIELGLSPTAPGISMVRESLSHLLSLVQAVCGAAVLELVAVRASEFGTGTRIGTLELSLRAGGRPVVAALRLRCVPRQPRPSWLSIDGRRIDRRVDVRGGGYRMAFERPDGMRVAQGDPLRALVYGLSLRTKERDVDESRHEADRIHGRARLYAAVLDRIGGGCRRSEG